MTGFRTSINCRSQLARGFAGALALLFSATAALAAVSETRDESAPLPAEGHKTGDVIAAAAPDASRAIKLDIRAALDVALSRNPIVRLSREKVAEADAFPGIALSAFLPQISISGAATYKKDPLDIGNPAFGGQAYNFYDTNAKLSQSLTVWGPIWAGLRDARYEKSLRALDVKATERDLSLQVLQAFYSILLAQRKLQSLERNMGVQDDLLKMVHHRLGIGRSQLLDVLQIQTQKALLVPQIAQARNDVRTNAAALALLLGEREATEFRLPDALEPVDGRVLLDKSRVRREPLPELEHAQGVRDQFEEKRSETLGKFLPTLALAGTWGRQSYVKTDLFDEYSTYWNVGLQLTIPVLSGLESIYDRRQLASQASQLEIAQSQTIDAKSLAEVRAREALELALSNMDSSREAYRLAGKSLNEARRTYRLATIDYQQFLTTEQSYFQAEVSFEQAKYDTINTAAQYCVAAGIPLNQFIELLGVKQ